MYLYINKLKLTTNYGDLLRETNRDLQSEKEIYFSVTISLYRTHLLIKNYIFYFCEPDPYFLGYKI